MQDCLKLVSLTDASVDLVLLSPSNVLKPMFLLPCK